MINQQITDLLQANFEGLPLLDRIGAASTLSTLYHFVVDNDVEDEYCPREEVLSAADRLYTALLMSYVTSENPSQATHILLAQADLIFGLQAVPNRRRVDCFLSAATKHLTAYSDHLDFISGTPTHTTKMDEYAIRRLAYLCQTFGAALPKTIQTYLSRCPDLQDDPFKTQTSTDTGKKHRFIALQSTLTHLDQEIQSALLPTT